MTRINIVTILPCGKTQKYQMDVQKSFQHLLTNFCSINKLREEGMVILLDNTPLDLSLTPDDCGMSKEVVLFITGPFMSLNNERERIDVLIDDLTFRIWTDTPLNKCLSAYCQHTGRKFNTLANKGYMLDLNLTPEYYAMKNGQQLTALNFD